MKLIEENNIAHTYLEDDAYRHIFDLNVFHDQILTNDTEIFEEIYNSEHLDELERMHHWQDETPIIEKKTAEALSAQTHTVGGLITAYYLGYLTALYWIWVDICCGFITLVIVCALGWLILPKCFMLPFELLGDLFLWLYGKLHGEKPKNRITKRRRRRKTKLLSERDFNEMQTPKERTKVHFRPDDNNNEGLATIEEAEPINIDETSSVANSSPEPVQSPGLERQMSIRGRWF
jgi:hypothetical protein